MKYIIFFQLDYTRFYLQEYLVSGPEISYHYFSVMLDTACRFNSAETANQVRNLIDPKYSIQADVPSVYKKLSPCHKNLGKKSF